MVRNKKSVKGPRWKESDATCWDVLVSDDVLSGAKSTVWSVRDPKIQLPIADVRFASWYAVLPTELFCSAVHGRVTFPSTFCLPHHEQNTLTPVS